MIMSPQSQNRGGSASNNNNGGSSNNNSDRHRESVWDDDMSLEDHRVVVGFPAGMLTSFYMGSGNAAATDNHHDHHQTTTATAAENSIHEVSTNSGESTTMSASTTITSDDSSFDRTIVSSAPSEDLDHPMVGAFSSPSAFTSISSVQSLPDLLQESQKQHDPATSPVITSSFPPTGGSSFTSISTTTSEYRYVEWPSYFPMFTSTHHSSPSPPPMLQDLDLSLRPSMVDSSSVMSTTTSPSSTSIALSTSQNSLTHHGSAVFVNIGQQLTQQDVVGRREHHPLERPASTQNIWYEGFTDVDWEQFRQVGQMVLNAVLEADATSTSTTHASTTAQIVTPPVSDILSEPSSDATMSETSPPGIDPVAMAQEVLPAALLCPLCHDVVVGATVLDCGCAASTLCAECWQGHVDHLQALALADARKAGALVESDFVWVSGLPSTTGALSCPTCQRCVHRGVVCPALEAAIQVFLRQLPHTRDPLKRHYRRRFHQWRETCRQREAHQRAALEEQHRNKLLAQLIAREEEVLWKCRKPPSYWQRCGRLLTSESFLLVVAVAVSLGFAIKAGAKK